MKRTAFLLMAFIAVAGRADDVKFSRGVSCDAPAKDSEGKCSGGLSVSGDDISMITIKGIPTDRPVNVYVNGGVTPVVKKVLSEGHATIEIPVHTKRAAFRTWSDDERKNNPLSIQLGPMPSEISVQVSRDDANTKAPDEKVLMTEAEWEKAAEAKKMAKEAKPADEKALMTQAEWEKAAEEKKKAAGFTYTFHIPVQWEAWVVESGGFWAYSLARDEEIGKAPSDDKKTVTISKRKHGDRVGPMTGVIANVHSGNYPMIGVEFGTAVDKDRGTSLFLGPNLRFQTLGEKALMAIGFGMSIVHSRQFPDLKNGDIVPTDDSRLTGVFHSRFAPYVSVSLAVNIGSSSK